jgi:restriction system protein
MSANPTERKAQLLRKLFEILVQAPDGSMRSRDALAQLARAMPLTEYEQGTFATGGQRFDYLVRFVGISAVKAGWLVRTKGLWTVTEAGRTALKQYPVPGDFLRAASQLYWQWKKAQPKSAATLPDADSDLEDEAAGEEASITFEKAEEQAWAEIENYLRKMPPYDFQELVADLLRAMGYHVSWVAPPGKDGGIDILAWTDPLGTRPPRIKVQVKRLNSTTSVDGLRAFLAVLGNDDVGLFVSTGGFTRDAEQEARTQENRKITLVDLDRLFDLWVEHYEKLSNTARQRLPLRPLYFLSPDT